MPRGDQFPEEVLHTTTNLLCIDQCLTNLSRAYLGVLSQNEDRRHWHARNGAYWLDDLAGLVLIMSAPYACDPPV